MIIDWQKIDIVMLDMDGTILDLHYDNFFWQKWLPNIYAEQHGMTMEEAFEYLQPIFKSQEGLLNWYCIDYWSQELKIDIEYEKKQQDVINKIKFREGAEVFLKWLKQKQITTWLVTNAHPKVLSIKSSILPLTEYFDEEISSHNIGHPKEDQQFWLKLRQSFPFEPNHVLFIDDSHSVLRSAQEFGLNVLGIHQPDSMQQPLRPSLEFNLVKNFDVLF